MRVEVEEALLLFSFLVPLWRLPLRFNLDLGLTLFDLGLDQLLGDVAIKLEVEYMQFHAL